MYLYLSIFSFKHLFYKEEGDWGGGINDFKALGILNALLFSII